MVPRHTVEKFVVLYTERRSVGSRATMAGHGSRRLSACMLCTVGLAFLLFSTYVVQNLRSGRPSVENVTPTRKAQDNRRVEPPPAVQVHEADRSESDESTPAPDSQPDALIVSEVGNVALQFFMNSAPRTVRNFVHHAVTGFYNQSLYYRLEKDFVIQAGGWNRKHSKQPPVPLEYREPNIKYSVAMARTSEPNSAVSEYFINMADNSRWLGPSGTGKHGYAVFAKVVDGFDTLARISTRHTKNEGLTILDPPITIHHIAISNRVLSALK